LLLRQTMRSKLSIIFSSHLSDDENNEFIKHVKETVGQVDVYVHCIVNKRQYSLTEAYNLGWNHIKEIGRGDGIIVFCHNDIVFKTKDWGRILLGLFKYQYFDIIGIAGTTELNSHGCWWLTPDGKEMNHSKMFGRVWHTNGLREWESIYSEKISGVKEVVTIDGLFMAVNGRTVAEMFDERFKGFHLYDISFCFRNYLEGCNIGVVDRISVMHKSVGETNSEWEENRQLFVELYKDDLPAKIIL